DCQQAVREIYVDPKLRKYLLDIIQATREHDEIHLGGSPRASIALFRTAQAVAAIGGRNFVLPDDIKRMALPVLGHRLILRPESRLRKISAAAVINEIMSEVPVPVLKGEKEEREDVFA